MSRPDRTPPEIAGYADTHFHVLHSLNKGLELDEILTVAFDSGMDYGIDVATGLERLKDRLALAETFPRLFFSVGCYPSYAEKELDESLFAELQRQTGSHASIVAIGEIGLDYHWDYGTRARQKELFKRQIEVANSCKLPIIIHCREAEEDLLNVLKICPPKEGGVLHCFSADYAFACRCIEAGLMISFAGNLTYKNATAIQETAARIPSDRLLLETDAPYLAPVPMRGKVNRPELLRFTARYLGELRGTAPRKMAKIAAANGRRLFNLPE